MRLLPAELQPVLAPFEDAKEAFGELQVAESLGEFRLKNTALSCEAAQALDAECFAFYVGACREGNSVWGAYLQPIMSGLTHAGERIDQPSLTVLTRDALDYLAQRATESRHPVLKARYADVVWDLRRKTTGDAPDVALARVAIDA